MTDTIELTHTYHHPIEKVWQAISDANAISKWFIQADFKPTVGYAYTFTHESTRIVGEVIKVDKPHELTYTWIVDGTDTTTTVQWLLTEDGSCTTLTLKHSGIDAYADSAAKMFESFRQGWGHCASELEKYLDGADEKTSG